MMNACEPVITRPKRKQLTPEQKLEIAGRYNQGQIARSIAELVGVATPTVQQFVYRTRKEQEGHTT